MGSVGEDGIEVLERRERAHGRAIEVHGHGVVGEGGRGELDAAVGDRGDGDAARAAGRLRAGWILPGVGIRVVAHGDRARGVDDGDGLEGVDRREERRRAVLGDRRVVGWPLAGWVLDPIDPEGAGRDGCRTGSRDGGDLDALEIRLDGRDAFDGSIQRALQVGVRPALGSAGGIVQVGPEVGCRLDESQGVVGGHSSPPAPGEEKKGGGRGAAW